MSFLDREPNELRYRGPNHVESYFLRAVDPGRPRALWLKATVLAPTRGEAVAEAWAISFDGEGQRHWAKRLTVPVREAALRSSAGNRVELSVGPTVMRLGPEGSAQGALEGLSWDLRWRATPGGAGAAPEQQRVPSSRAPSTSLGVTGGGNARGENQPPPGPAAAPLSLYPTRLLLVAPFPKLKVLTPFPSLRVDGAVTVFGERLDVSGWVGSQGHNYGTQHPHEYAWGQCVFPAQGEAPETVVEGASFRLKVAGLVTPRLSVLVVRRGAKEYRFDTILDRWRQDASLARWRWTARLANREATASLTLDAERQPMVCLGYGNPDGSTAYCFNTKLAHAWLSVEEKDGPGFSLESAHGGALEFLQPQPDPQFPDVV